MGAEVFYTEAKGATAQEAFKHAVDAALWDYGHAGYSGTIAEKDSFVEIALPEGKDAEQYAYELIDVGDERIDDKWGPAGCIHLGGDRWAFFGWASS